MTLSARQRMVIMFLLTIRENVELGQNTYDPFSAYMAHVSSMMMLAYRRGTIEPPDAKVIKIAREIYMNYGRDYRFKSNIEIFKVSVKYLQQFFELKDKYTESEYINFQLQKGHEYNQFVTYIKTIRK